MDDWARLRRSLPRIAAEARDNGLDVKTEDIKVVTPDTYPNPLT
ncbi:hypothetical protein [Infirmifilum lucidum]|nr:hypothetical protein [Infirmifilum lucidum]